ncbi:hypothetical protein PHLCEN_2v10485 [Hermanssonia centrifuga]|uniref:Uncharacterized protein n=1 Tax=Hermanssonia centrifuga TaxID=98765 RepID=A0A2R6NNE6_9APHY|nr:hypothetical protein PHLCEN_2v10485 [Hermanssonia centrifuga]
MDFHPQPRHTSDASVSSQTTFPIRNDAYIATDLSMRPGDELTSTKSPPLYLPYPALASSPLRSASALPSAARSYQVPLSNGPPRSGTGFFASMGRKASLKKDRGPVISPPSPSRVLTKRFPNQNNQVPRALQLNSAPAIRGGPRAAPGRVQRSQTISIAPAPAPAQEQPVTVARSETSHHRQSTSNRRPSIFHRSTQPAAVAPVAIASPEFERQVDRLADLLPNADRKLLSAYLRRAGEDVLAIGQYLEDEKNGTLRYD